MHGQFVALDLETTGLDTSRDEIIEIGAVRFVDGEETDTYHIMVKPAAAIPPRITHLTGISQDDVSDAPSIERVLPDVATFIGSSPLVAHNIALDIGFLRDRYGILRHNIPLDTYDLASVLLPSVPRYNLNSLTQELGIDLPHAHRALDDARGAGRLYWRLWEMAQDLPRETILQILRLGEGLDWPSLHVFQAALRTAKASRNQTGADELSPPSHEPSHRTLEAGHSNNAVTPQDLVSYLGPEGILKNYVPGFQHRPQQLELAVSVADALSTGGHLIAEAGTGSGKTLAYLLPAALWAVQSNGRVIISTDTINLQEQILHDVVPMLQRSVLPQLRVTVMKGRSNYLSPERLATVLRQRPSSVAELRTLAKLLVWRLHDKSGDRSNISLRGPEENSIWRNLSAEHLLSPDDCTLPAYLDAPFCIARQRAAEAHIIIVNHALLIEDARAVRQVLPDYNRVIIDEAHQLEEAVTRSLSTQIDHATLHNVLSRVGSVHRGPLSDVIKASSLIPNAAARTKINAFAESIAEAVAPMQVYVERFFVKATAIATRSRGKRNDYVSLARINDDDRATTEFAAFNDSWLRLREFFDVVIDALSRLANALSRHSQSVSDQTFQASISALSFSTKWLKDRRAEIEAFVAGTDSNLVCWLALPQGAASVSLHTAPLQIGQMIDQHLWQSKQSAVLIGATLQTAEGFEYIKRRLHAATIPTTDIGSPFNYRESALLYLPDDIGEPSSGKDYQRAVERAIIELSEALDGRVLVLFTGYSHLRQTAQAVAPRLRLGNIALYDQSDGTSREALLDGFKHAERAVLMGTRSFWQGIDIPGDALSGLIITKLPFAVPTDPVFSARAEMHSHPFDDFNVPDAILRFRQGFGRLIRHQSDRGIAVVMDSRVLTKRYGKRFIDSLPDVTVKTASLDHLASTAREWLG